MFESTLCSRFSKAPSRENVFRCIDISSSGHRLPGNFGTFPIALLFDERNSRELPQRNAKAFSERYRVSTLFQNAHGMSERPFPSNTVLPPSFIVP